MRSMLLGLVLFIAGCLTPTVPYVRESVLGDLPRDWATSLGTGRKVITVYNPTDQPRVITVWCRGDIYEGKQEYAFSVRARSEAHAIIYVNNRDLIVEVCEVTDVQ